jgi:hypothetical protein
MNMAAQPDLWGDLQVLDDVQAPVTILRQQAALLGPKTRNLIEARVVTSSYGDTLVHNFCLVAPSLDSYKYELFSVTHAIPELYPVQVSRNVELGTEQELLEWLRKQLSSPETKKIIGILLAQVKG